MFVQQEHHGVILCYWCLKTVVFRGKFSAHLLNCFLFFNPNIHPPKKPNLTLPVKSTQVHWHKNITAIRHRSTLHFTRLNHFQNLPIYNSEWGSCCFTYAKIWNIKPSILPKSEKQQPNSVFCFTIDNEARQFKQNKYKKVGYQITMHVTLGYLLVFVLNQTSFFLGFNTLVWKQAG